jgi:hypothetical protein
MGMLHVTSRARHIADIAPDKLDWSRLSMAVPSELLTQPELLDPSAGQALQVSNVCASPLTAGDRQHGLKCVCACSVPHAAGSEQWW